jgi:hypothetical protein
MTHPARTPLRVLWASARRTLQHHAERVIARALMALTAHLPLRIISENGRPYLERYFIFHTPWVRCYLHRFVGSDPERGLHDHPWRWAASLVLTGWYLEAKRDGWHQVRLANWLTGDTFHRVVMPIGQHECWTLFIHTTHDVKPWGFAKATVDGLPNSHELARALGIEGGVAFHWAAYEYHGKQKDHRWERTAPKGHHLREASHG